MVAAVLAVVVHVTALYLPTAPDLGATASASDKLVHALIFAVPVWLIGVLTGRVWLVASVFAGHAVVSELVQHWFLPNRTGDPFDLLADLAGIAVAVGLLLTRRERAGRPGVRRRRQASPLQ